MFSTHRNYNMSEDDDLEVLRKAALLTLRKRSMVMTDCFTTTAMTPHLLQQLNPFHANFGKRWRGCNPSRPLRYGHSNGRMLTNLIAIPTLETREVEPGALVRPRGCVDQESKFSRYDDNDDEERDEWEEDESGKLKRSSSLDALMDELEYEISGKKATTNGTPASKNQQERKSEEVKVEELGNVRITSNGTKHESPTNYENRFILPTPNVIPRPKTYSQGEYTSTVNSCDSAAFVLQNREICEKRKRSSPRRAFSRSPSPRTRERSRSRSPRKLLSPQRRHQPSTSPKSVRKEPSQRRSRSPRRERRMPEVHEESTDVKSCEEVSDTLAAKEPSVPKSETSTPDDIDTLELNVDIDLGTKLEDMFSDDESLSDNEGRFKCAAKSISTTAAARPFSMLRNCSYPPSKSREEAKCERHRHERKHRSHHAEIRYSSARKPDDSWRRRGYEEKSSATERTASRREHEHRSSSRHARPESKSSRNSYKRPHSPTSSEQRVAKDNVGRTTIVRQVSSRKVDIPKVAKDVKKTNHDDDVIVTVIDDDDDGKKTEGDLRVQLSRKRAERQHKTVVSTEDVQQRLLHNALGAVFRKSKNAKRDEDGAAPSKDKLSIRQRLGFGKEKEELSMKTKKYRDHEQLDVEFDCASLCTCDDERSNSMCEFMTFCDISFP